MKRIMALTMALLIFLVGCGSSKEGDDEAPQEYTTAYAQEIETLNYLVTASEVEYGLAANLVDTLVDYDRYQDIAYK